MLKPLTLVTALLLAAASQAQQFTIPVFPDSQAAVAVADDRFFSQMEWLADSGSGMDIPIVLHVGDVVDFDNYTHWDIASRGYEALDNAGIPYAIALGNHDTRAVGKHSGSAAPGNVNRNLRTTDKFNSYFPVHRFTLQRGRMEEGRSDNAYHTFCRGNTLWLVLVVEFCPRMAALNWAADVIAAYPEYNVIILTHYYLDRDGTIAAHNAGYGDFSPKTMHDRLVGPFTNVKLVLGGHVSGTAMLKEENREGGNVYSLLQNYQNEDLGGGYLRLLHIDVEGDRITTQIYSPYHDRIKDDPDGMVLENIGIIKFR